MVQGLNWNNYSANQIVEMKNNGIEVPEEVYNKAEAALNPQEAAEVTAQQGDASSLSYTVYDDSGKINEAKELRAQLEEEGANLKEMVKTFTKESIEASTSLEASMKEIENYVSYVSVNEQTAKALSDQANDEQAVVIELAKQTEEQVKAKEDEFDFLNEKIENGTATEAEQAKAEEVGAEIQEVAADGNAKIAEKSKVANNLAGRLSMVQGNMAEVANNTGKAINKAGDGIELAKETNELSTKLYKQGKKTQAIATALGAVVGGVGGFFAGKAIGNKINDNKFDQFIAKNGLEITGKSTTIYVENGKTVGSTSENIYQNKNGVNFYEDEINKEINAKQTGNIAKIGGAVVGAGLGAAVGSLFGRGKIEAGQAGKDAARELTTIANQTKNLASKIAEQNGFTVQVAEAADVEVTDLTQATEQGAVDAKAKDVATLDNTQANETTNPETADDKKEDEKKKQA